MTDLRTFLSEMALDPSKFAEFLREPESAIRAHDLSKEDGDALLSGIPAMIWARLAAYLAFPPPYYAPAPVYVTSAPTGYVTSLPPVYVTSAPTGYVTSLPPVYVTSAPAPVYVTSPPPLYVTAPPPLYVAASPHYVTGPPPLVMPPIPRGAPAPAPPKKSR